MPSFFPVLPVLNTVESSLDGRPLLGIGVVGVQHVLLSTGSLLESLIRLGAEPQDIFICGKWYSTNDEVYGAISALGVQIGSTPTTFRPGFFGESCEQSVDRLWLSALDHFARRGIRRILVLDDGGYCFSRIPPQAQTTFSIVGVEQTTSGLKRAAMSKIPSVAVASASIKRRIESPLVADAVVAAMPSLALAGEMPVGVVGLGAIGQAIRSVLVSRGFDVIESDPTLEPPWKLPWQLPRTLAEVVGRCRLIIGCSGSDVSKQLSSNHFANPGDTYLASASSGDVEFNHLIRSHFKFPTEASREPDLVLNTSNGRLHILNHGCPVNFRRSLESVPSEDIQITRALLLAGALQAVSAEVKHAQLRPIARDYERLILTSWLRTEAGRAFQRKHPQTVAECSSELFVEGKEDNVAA